MSDFKSVQVTFGQESAEGNELYNFVVTGSQNPPIVTLAENGYFPSVKDIYANGDVYHGKKGIRVKIRLDGPARGDGIIVNISQPDMTGDFTVIPMH